MFQSQTLTQSLTPLQEKAVLGVDFSKYTDADMVESSDTTFVTLQGIASIDETTLNTWFTAIVQNQYQYTLVVIAMDKMLESGAITATQAIERLVSIELFNLPAFSNLLAWQYLKSVIRRLSNVEFNAITTFKSFESSWGKVKSSNGMISKVFLYLSAFFHFQSNTVELKELIKSLNEYSLDYSNTLEFPKAETSNNELINPLMNLLIYLWRKPNVKFNVAKSLTRCLQTTYHNSRVVKLSCLNAIKLNHPKECMSTFKTYINYINDYKVKHKGVYDDLVDTISLYTVVLEYLSKHIKTHDDFKEVSEFEAQLKHLMCDYLIYFVGDVSAYYIPELQNYLNFVYTTLGVINENCIPFSSKAIDQSIDDMICLTTKAIKSVHDNPTVDKKRLAFNFYKNSYYLHKSGDDDGAIKRIKRAVVNDPDDVSYLTFLIKLYSGDEETHSMAIELAADVLTNALLLPNKTLKVKNDITELYLIYLTLLQSDAVDHLAGMFGALNELFNDQFKELKVNPNPVKAKVPKPTGDANADRCSPCEPTKSRKFKFSSGSLSNKKASSGKTVPATVAPAATNGALTLEMVYIQKIWLNISRLLQGLDSAEGAMDALEAAEGILRNGETEARRGCLLLGQGDLKAGLRHIEMSLEQSSGGISAGEAVMGMYYFGRSEEAETRAKSLAQTLVESVEFTRDAHLLFAVGALHKSTRAWGGMKIL